LSAFGTETVVQFRKIEISELRPGGGFSQGSHRVRKTPSPLPPAALIAVPTADSDEKKALRELVAAKERGRDSVKTRFEAGAVPPQSLRAAEVELLEARIRLAQAEGPKEAVVSLLKELVTNLMEQRKLVQQRVENGLEVSTALTDADAKVADAQARLAKAEAPLPPK
jgi:outer membrane protein TolC